MTIEQEAIKEFREKKRKNEFEFINERPNYTAIESFLLQAIKETREEVCKEIIKLSDEIEMREPDGGTREWMAFKCFRNTLRDRYLINKANKLK